MKLVAECGLSHDGSLRRAIEFIDAVATVPGVWGVKFQCHDYDPCNQWRPGVTSAQDSDRQSYYRRTAFTADHWQSLYWKASESGLAFGCSFFAWRGLDEFGGKVDFIKIPSGEMDNGSLLATAARTNRPLVLSTGMSSYQEVKAAIELCRICEAKDLTILECTSLYPCPFNKCNVDPRDIITVLGIDDIKVGVSDHSGTIYPGLLAAWNWSDMVEVHVTLSEHDTGPDASSALTIDDLRRLADGVRFIDEYRSTPRPSKDDMAQQLESMREVFRSGR